ncbi:MAG TPA: hypothetical protein VNU21_06310 [Usitatibacter sp.]|jgi:hypothetical protein|nr:hypothetical protein [Usitatibacter sp.]
MKSLRAPMRAFRNVTAVVAVCVVMPGALAQAPKAAAPTKPADVPKAGAPSRPADAKAAPAKAAPPPKPFEAAIPVDGNPVAVALDPAGKPARLAFTARAGQRLGLGIVGLKFTPPSASGLVVTVRQPDGTLLPGLPHIHCTAASQANPSGSCDAEIAVQHAGRHVVEIDPPFSAVAEFRALLSTPASATLSGTGSQNVRIGRAGQDANVRLKVGAGDDVVVDARRTSSGGLESPFKLRALSPDGTPLGEGKSDPSGVASIAFGGPAGEYTVQIDPDRAGTGSYAVSARVSPVEAMGGPPLEFAGTAPGQAVRVVLDIPAGKTLSLALDRLKLSPASQSGIGLALYRPDGGRMGALTCAAEGPGVPACKTPLIDSPPAGRYRVEVQPPRDATVSGRLITTEPVAGKIPSSGQVRVAAMKPAQPARYSFEAKKGMNVGIVFDKYTTLPPGAEVTVTLQRVSEKGLGFSSMNMGTGDKISVRSPTLQEDGAYTVLVDPGAAALQGGELTVTGLEGDSK